MQHVTETADAGAPTGEQPDTTDEKDRWHLNTLQKFRFNIYKFETESNISNDCAALVAGAISRCSKLTEVKICGNDTEFMQSFASGLDKCLHLERLDLSSNNIGDEDIDSLLKVIERCPNLVSLTLLNNKVGPDGEEKLRNGLKAAERQHTLKLELHQGC